MNTTTIPHASRVLFLMGFILVLYDLDRERGVVRLGKPRLFTVMMEILAALSSAGKEVEFAQLESCFDLESHRLLEIIAELRGRSVRVPALTRECDAAKGRIGQLNDQLAAKLGSFEARYLERLEQGEAGLTALQAAIRQQVATIEGIDQERDRLHAEAAVLREQIEALQLQIAAEEHALAAIRVAHERRRS